MCLSERMILKKLRISTWIGDDTNCYIILDPESKETMVVDPAGDVDKIIEMIDINEIITASTTIAVMHYLLYKKK